MKRQAENVRSTVYRYGSVPVRIAPVLGEDGALQQMRLGRRLWNTLVAIDRTRTEVYRRIMHDETQAEIDRLKEREDALWAQIRALRHKAQKKTPAPPGLADELARIRAARVMLGDHQKTTRDARHAARREQLAALGERSFRRVKKARQAAASMGLYWGTYNAVVQSADVGHKLGELRFRGFRGEGTVTAQVQGGAAVHECIAGGNSFFQVEPPVASRKWRYARVRIGSSGDRSPLWVAIPIVYHRDIPSEARIKSVSATRRLVAGKPRWTVNVTVTVPPVIATLSGEIIAVDIGWRLLPAGVRVAYWQDGAGAHGQLVIPMADIRGFEKVRELRSICDRSRDEFLPRLSAWFGQQALSEEWQGRISHLAQWRSTDRLATLVRWWSDNRFARDQEMHEAARAWRKQYLHLADWWRNQQDQMVARIREEHRCFATGISRRYDTVILEDFALPTVVEKKPDETKGARAGSNYRQMVSPGGFRAILINACKREGVEVRIVSGAYTTVTCHACQAAENWDHAANVIHRCSQCGALWDQDRNAAINLLARGRAMTIGNEQDSDGIVLGAKDRSHKEGKRNPEATAQDGLPSQ
jgi:hypothetical protein